jgi:hypothetical protein
MIEPDIILPSQFLQRVLATPEKRLLLAVLEEAVGTYQRYAMMTDGRSRAVFAEVEAWFASEDVTRLYAFVPICEALGLDATYVRSGLEPWAAKHRQRWHDTAPPCYRFPFRRIGGTRQRTTGRAAGLGRQRA